MGHSTYSLEYPGSRLATKVDEANVDTSKFIESSSQWIWVLEARAY